MRVHRALDLARWVLTTHQGMQPKEIQKILDSLEETTITLDPPIPIFVEYNTVSVDEDGRVMFLIDVYHYDWAYWRGLLPFQTHLKLNEREYLEALAYKKAHGRIDRAYFEKLFERKFKQGTLRSSAD